MIQQITGYSNTVQYTYCTICSHRRESLRLEPLTTTPHAGCPQCDLSRPVTPTPHPTHLWLFHITQHDGHQARNTTTKSSAVSHDNISQMKSDSTTSTSSLDQYHDSETLPALAPASEGDSSCNSRSSSSSSTSSLCAALPAVIQTAPPRNRKDVSFGTVSFRSFPVILGDHPDCLGPPVSTQYCSANCSDFGSFRASVSHNLRSSLNSCYQPR